MTSSGLTARKGQHSGIGYRRLVSRPKQVSLFVAALCIIYVGVGLATLAVFPRVWMDEPWYAQSAWSFTQDGTFALPMFADLAGFDRDNAVYGRTYLLAVAGAFELAGVGPFGARLASFVSGLVALIAVFGIGRELWGQRVAAIAALLLAVAPPFILQSHDARPELMLVAGWTVAFYLVISGERTRSRWRMVAGGIVATLAADAHLNGAIVPVALFIVLLYRRPVGDTLRAYLLGVILGSAWWAVAHLSDLALFYDQVALFSRGAPYLEVLADPVYVFGAELFRYILVEPRGSVLLVLMAAIAGTILLVKRRDTAVMSLLVFSLIVFLFMALASGARTPIYAVILWPVLALLVARLMDISSRPMALAVTTLVVAVSLAQVGLIALREAPGDYDGYVARLREHVPPDATVQAQEPVWFGFAGRPFVATHYFMFAGPYEDEVRRLGIDYIIADEFFLDLQLHQLRNIDASEVESFLRDHTSLVAQIEDSHYGRTQHGGGDPPYITKIYRVNGETAVMEEP